MHVDKVNQSANFPLIYRVLDFHFQGQIFKSSSLESSYMIISKSMTDRINISIGKTKIVDVGIRLAL